MSGQRGDTDCLARSGLFIDDDNWFGNTRTSPIRLRTTTCAFRAHQHLSSEGRGVAMLNRPLAVSLQLARGALRLHLRLHLEPLTRVSPK